MTKRASSGLEAARATRTFNLVLAGVGGQGILLASRVLCQAAMDEGHPVNSFESHGMAQRGGAVFATIRWGPDARSSLILEQEADMLVAFEPVEALRRLMDVSSSTTAVLNTRAIAPISVSSVKGKTYPSAGEVLDTLGEHVARVVALDGSGIAERLGNPALLSAVMLGAAWASGSLPLDPKLLRRALERVVPERYLELNRAAFEEGGRAVAS